MGVPPPRPKTVVIPEYDGSHKLWRVRSVCGKSGFNKERTKTSTSVATESDKVGLGPLLGWHVSLCDPRH